MFKKLKPLKDLLWAAGIGIALFFLLFGLVAVNFTSYHGDKARPVMDLRSDREEGSDAAADSDDTESEGSAMTADGTLHPLAETGTAKKSYLKKLTILCDSSFVSLRGYGANTMTVWTSEDGKLPMTSVSDWKIVYPGDGSLISPTNAMLVAKPKILVIAIGSDVPAKTKKSAFISSYSTLIRNLAKANPDAKIVCLSLCCVTESHDDSDGMTPERAVKINGWIQEVCIETGAFYGDLSDTLCFNGFLREDFADESGRALNEAGLDALFTYLRNHDVTRQ